MDKFYRYLREQPPGCVYYHYDRDSSMLTIGTGQVFARFYEPDFKPNGNWKEHPAIAKAFEKAAANAEGAVVAKIIYGSGIVLAVGENKAAAVNPEHLRLFEKIIHYRASEVNGIAAAVVTFKKGMAVISGYRTHVNGQVFGFGHELVQVKEMIEKVLSMQISGQAATSTENQKPKKDDALCAANSAGRL
jgi:hypothetical protein